MSKVASKVDWTGVGAWEDDAIVQAFDAAVKAQRRGQAGTEDTEDPEDEAAAAPMPGAWEPVPVRPRQQDGGPGLTFSAADLVQAAAEMDEEEAEVEQEEDAGPQSQAQWPPVAPPPMLPGVDDEALSDLLLAWYYSGYYTGRYQATQEFRKQYWSQAQQHPAPPHAP